MADPQEELLEIADRLMIIAEQGTGPEITKPCEALKDAANEIANAWSGSWLGYHANVYYENLEPPPPGAHFSQEWGLMDTYGSSRLGSHGCWRECETEAVKNAVVELAGNPSLEPAREVFDKAARAFDLHKSDVVSILTTELTDTSDPFLGRLKEQIDSLSVMSKSDVQEALNPKNQLMTRDTTALGQGNRVPPHISVISEVLAIEHTFSVVTKLAEFARQAGSHMSRQQRRWRRAETVGTKIFIGHGGSRAWRDLKDFVQDRLGLPWDEFNRLPIAGVTNIARLSEMLDSAAIAFLVMTGEDELKDGKLHARMNVVHEAGLFQGRLGFTRAIVLLEDGCEEFGNIEGLGQIRFPKGNIAAAFEEIRRVLEREEIISSD